MKIKKVRQGASFVQTQGGVKWDCSISSQDIQ